MVQAGLEVCLQVHGLFCSPLQPEILIFSAPMFPILRTASSRWGYPLGFSGLKHIELLVAGLFQPLSLGFLDEGSRLLKLILGWVILRLCRLTPLSHQISS